MLKFGLIQYYCICWKCNLPLNPMCPSVDLSVGWLTGWLAFLSVGRPDILSCCNTSIVPSEHLLFNRLQAYKMKAKGLAFFMSLFRTYYSFAFFTEVLPVKVMLFYTFIRFDLTCINLFHFSQFDYICKLLGTSGRILSSIPPRFYLD